MKTTAEVASLYDRMLAPGRYVARFFSDRWAGGYAAGVAGNVTAGSDEAAMQGTGGWRVIVGRALTVLTVMLLACGGGATTADSAASHSRAAASSGPIDPEIVSFIKLMNAHRVSLGLSALVWDSRLAAVAQAHSRAMFDRHYFSHKWPGGGSTWDRLAARGVTYSQAGENIAWGQSTGSAALRAWLRSPGHRANIEHGSYTHHGVGKVGTYWTHVFIRATGASQVHARQPLHEDHSSPE